MSKSDDTIKAYVHRGQCLWSRAASDLDRSVENLLPSEYLQWLERLLPTLKPASRRQYIASSRQWLDNLKQCNPYRHGDQKNLADAICKGHEMQSWKYAPVEKKSVWRGRTSSQKAKRVSLEDLAKIGNEATSMRGKWNREAVLWLQANVAVGLRPSEWRFARIEVREDRQILVVRNGKHSNGRSNGSHRHLDITELTPGDLVRVRLQLKVIRQIANDDLSWKTYYEGVRQAIRRIFRNHLGGRRKYPSLYSTRHQFAADAKASGLRKVEVAALMGHAIDETAGMHYCAGRHGNGRCMVKPDKREVAMVRMVLPKQQKQNLRS